jgi:uncharacterized membrane protein YdbT with pleckstrin-like domain
MSYVKSQLLPAERIEYRAHLHKILFVPAFFVMALALVIAAFAPGTPALWLAAGGVAVLAAAIYLLGWIRYRTSEFAVTDRRVIIKTGVIQRRTMETLLNKIEAIGVDQSLVGRLLGFGTITVIGTGGTREEFPRIAAPLEFRKHVQAQGREERECPFCAERVLTRAKVCRYCGRDLPPLPPSPSS